MPNVSLKELVEAGAHFGHQSKRWNPKMAPYLYGVREGIHIFDLVKTKEKLDEVLALLKKAPKEGKTIIFLGTKKQAKDKIAEVAKATNTFYVNERWLGGTLTNFEQIKKSIRKLADMKQKMQNNEYREFTKKERLLLEREIARLDRFFGGLSGITDYPDYLIVVDTKKENGAIREARDKGIEVIGLVDSNADPTVVDYPIPMNDDATRAVDYVLDLMRDALLEGKGVKVSKSKKESVKKKAKKTKSNSSAKVLKGSTAKTKTSIKKASTNMVTKKSKKATKVKSKTKKGKK